MSGTTTICGLVKPELEDAPADIEVAVGVPLEQLDVLLNPVFTSPASRDATIVAPTAGMEAFCTSTREKYIYTGTQWVGVRPRTKRKALTETINNNTSFQADDALFDSVEANSHYKINVRASVLTDATAGLKWKFTIPTLASGTYEMMISKEGVPADIQHYLRYWDDATGDSASLATSVLHTLNFEGYLTTAANAGTFQFYWAQSTGVVFNTQVFFGSTIELLKVEL
jgi:hypothetical protein